MIWLDTVAVVLAASLLSPPAAEPSLQEILQKSSEYVQAYEESFKNLVADEEYLQYQLDSPGGRRLQSRSIHSDVVYAPIGGEIPFWLFRDVYKVDGREVRNREARLQKLFLEEPGSAVARARSIVAESARYNLGFTQRNFNVPTLALVFLHPVNQHRFRFELKGTKKVAGERCREVEYEETESPTLIVERPQGLDLVMRGRFLIRPEDGAVLKTFLAFSPRATKGRVNVEVQYRYFEDLELWLPEQMDEIYETRWPRGEAHAAPGSALLPRGNEYITCKARYTNYRRFEVETQEKYDLPE